MILNWLEKFAEKLSLCGAWVSAFLLVYMVCHILVEIFFRTVLDSSTYSLDEFVGYAVGAMTFLSLGHTFQRKALIRVNILTNSIKGLSILSSIDLLNTLQLKIKSSTNILLSSRNNPNTEMIPSEPTLSEDEP